MLFIVLYLHSRAHVFSYMFLLHYVALSLFSLLSDFHFWSVLYHRRFRGLQRESKWKKNAIMDSNKILPETLDTRRETLLRAGVEP